MDSESVKAWLEDEERRPTLRDQFAMASLSGLISRPDLQWRLKDDICRQAFEWADAMLTERDKPHGA